MSQGTVPSPSTSSTTWCQVETDFTSTFLQPGESATWQVQDPAQQPQAASADITIEKFHNGLPRFGHSNDLLEVINNVDDKNVQRDYVVGVVSWIIVIGVFFICWGCLMICLKCAGVAKVGMFAGTHPPRLERPTKPPKKQRHSHDDKKNIKKKHAKPHDTTPPKVKLIQKDGVTVAVPDDGKEVLLSPTRSIVQKDGVMVAVPPAPPLSADGDSHSASNARKKKRELEATFAAKHVPNNDPNQADSAATVKTSSTIHSDNDDLSHRQNSEHKRTTFSPPFSPAAITSPIKRRRNHVKLEDEEEGEITMAPPGVESPRRRRRQHVQLVEDDEYDANDESEVSSSHQRLSNREPDNPDDYNYRTALKNWRAAEIQRRDRLFRIRVAVTFALMGIIVALLAGLYYQGAIQTYIIGNNARGASFSSLGEQDESKSFSNFVQENVGLVALGVDIGVSNMQRIEQTTQMGVQLLNDATEHQRVVLKDAQTLFDNINGKRD